MIDSGKVSELTAGITVEIARLHQRAFTEMHRLDGAKAMPGTLDAKGSLAPRRELRRFRIVMGIALSLPGLHGAG